MKLVHKKFKDGTQQGEWLIIIGNFDGFHLGHQKLVDQLLKDKNKMGGNAGILTFSPHPKKILQPKVPFFQIYDENQKCCLLERSGLDSCFVIDFTSQFANQSPLEFIEKLFHFIRLKKIVVGYDFNFGKARQGSTLMLQKEAEKRGIEFLRMEPVKLDGITVSSTMIRRLLFEGDFKGVSRFLGRDWSISGEVKKGKGLGNQLGFPTLNLEPDVLYPLQNGVYACEVRFDNQRHQAVCNIGFRPTLGDRKYMVEAHLFDFKADLYGKRIEIQPFRFLREEFRFDSLDLLKKQIARDVEDVRRFFKQA